MRKGQNEKANLVMRTRTSSETEDYSLDKVVPFQYQTSSSIVNPSVLSVLGTRTALEYLTNERMGGQIPSYEGGRVGPLVSERRPGLGRCLTVKRPCHGSVRTWV